MFQAVSTTKSARRTSRQKAGSHLWSWMGSGCSSRRLLSLNVQIAVEAVEYNFRNSTGVNNYLLILMEEVNCDAHRSSAERWSLYVHFSIVCCIGALQPVTSVNWLVSI